MTSSNTSIESQWPRRQYRAPADDGGLLVEPAQVSPSSLMRANRTALDRSDILFGEQTLGELRRVCRRDVLRNACEYTARLRGVRPEMPSIDDDLIVTGHQPGLVHPGVWLKHWTAAAVARETAGVALNVVVDNDLCDGMDVRVPTGEADSPRLEAISLDHDFLRCPWEDVRVRDAAAFRVAGQRLSEAMANWNRQPIAGDAWDRLDEVDENDSLADHLTRIRHQTQQAEGASLLEVPVRNIARLPSFAQFVSFIVQRIEALSATYNEGLAIYRRLNKLRSQSHPMPDLERDGDLFETPLWVWRAGETQRRPLWARLDGCGVRLFDRQQTGDKLIGVVRDGDCQWDVWHRLLTDLDHQGYRVRPRALMTTLFLRLCLSDLFIHGIGGAKYDEVTDWIMRQFIGVEPPTFLTVSGTLRLELPTHDVKIADVTRLKSLARDMRYNPDRHEAVGPLVDEKQSLTAEQHAAANRNGEPRANRLRYQRLRAINEELFEQVRPQHDTVLNELDVTARRLAANDVLSSREFSWVLFERQRLLAWLRESADAIATTG